MKRETKKRLTARDLKAFGTTPGLVVRRIPPDGGRQRVEARRILPPAAPPSTTTRRAKGARA